MESRSTISIQIRASNFSLGLLHAGATRNGAHFLFKTRSMAVHIEIESND
jgi:hypothetical protein